MGFLRLSKNVGGWEYKVCFEETPTSNFLMSQRSAPPFRPHDHEMHFCKLTWHMKKRSSVDNNWRLSGVPSQSGVGTV